MVKAEGNPLKELLGELPFSAELFWLFRNREKPLNSRFSLKNFQQHLPEIITQIKSNIRENQTGKRVLLFASLHYWIEETALLGLTMAGAGYRPHLAYLPYFDWQKPDKQIRPAAEQSVCKRSACRNKTAFTDHPLVGLPEKTKITCRAYERDRDSQLL